jgi:transposase
MVTLDTAIREFTPQEGDWRPLEILFERAFSGPDPKRYYHAIFNLFERFPEEDGAGVFWSALHGMEAAGGYEELLLQYFRRHPSLMTTTMLRRINKSGQSHIGKVEIARLVTS